MKELKKALKAKMPRFIRTDAHKKKRVGTGWRRPKGLQNKMRLEIKGYRTVVKTGYKTPLQHTTNGLSIVLVHNLKELAALNPKTQAALLARVGRAVKEQLIAEAKKNKLTIVNLSVDKYLEKSKSLAEARAELKKARAEKEAAKKKVQKEKEAEAKKKEAEAQAKEEAEKKKADAASAEVQAEEHKKLEEKKEKDKVLTSKKGY